MSIKKFFVEADTSIYNAYKPSFKQRGTEANTGQSDSLEVFFLFRQDVRADAVLSDKLEEARIIIKPSFQSILDEYVSFPSNTKFVFKMYNAAHPFTLPRAYNLEINSITDVWEEGGGVDSDSYSDSGAASWNKRTPDQAWAAGEGALAAVRDNVATVSFVDGTEDIEVDITAWLQANWAQPSLPNTSFVISLPANLVDGTSEENYYTKKFYARSSEYFFKRPVIEARTSDAIFDNRANFYRSHPAYEDEQNEQNICIYNSVGGAMSDFKLHNDMSKELFVRLYSDAERTTPLAIDGANEFKGADRDSVGVYCASVELSDLSVDKVYDRWYYGANGGVAEEEMIIVYESEIDVKTRTPTNNTGHNDYFVSITNLKTSYSKNEKAKFRVYARLKDWSPTIYTVASKNIENNIVDRTYYKIVRIVDDVTVVDYGIGSDGLSNEHTRLSCDELGNYFDFDISLLEPGYMYGIKLMFSLNGETLEQPEIFKFRVD